MAVRIELPEQVARLWSERGGPIVKVGDPALRQVAQPVGRPTAATRELVDLMKAAMAEQRGVGLAAPQVGVLQRVVIYRVPEEGQGVRVLVDPKIVSARGEQIGPEGCLSIPYLQGDVKRAMEVTVKGLDMLGRPFKRRASEFEARVIQHELDHLDGVLFIDRVDPETLHWYLPSEASEEPEELPATAVLS